MARFFSTEEMKDKVINMGHDHYDVWDEHRRTLLLIMGGGKEGLKADDAHRLAAKFIEDLGGSFLVESRMGNSGNARKVTTYVSCAKTLKKEKDKENPSRPAHSPQPSNGHQSKQAIDEKIQQALSNYKNEEQIKLLKSAVEKSQNKTEKTSHFLDMCMDALANGAKRHYPNAFQMNGGNATVNDANYTPKDSASNIDDSLDVLCNIFGEDVLIKLAAKLNSHPDPFVINMVKDYATK